MILVLFMYMLFASTFTLGKIVLGYSDPLFFVATRMLIGGALLLGYEYCFNRKALTIKPEERRLYLKLMVFHVFLAFSLEYWGLQYVSGAKACLIYNLSPFITALYAYQLLKERLYTQQILGLIIGFAGFLPILLASTPHEALWCDMMSISLPEMALLGSVICAAFGWITFKRLVNTGNSFVKVNALSMLGGGVLSLIASFILEGRPHLKVPAIPDAISLWVARTFAITSPVIFFIGYALLLILIANVICYNLYGYLLKQSSATFLSFAGFTCPLFAAYFDWLFTGQIIGWPFVATLIMTSIGLLLFFQKEHCSRV